MTTQHTDVAEHQPHIEHILLLGSGSRLNIERTIESLAQRFPAARLTLVLDGGDDRRYSQTQVARVVHYAGLSSARRVQRQISGEPIDLKVVLFTGEGQATLKLLAFALVGRRLLVFTEGGGSFEWNFDHRLAIWNHLRWRMAGGRPLAGWLGRLARSLLTGILSLVGFTLLLLWHGGLLIQRLGWRLRAPAGRR